MTCAIDAFHRLQLILAADWQRNGWTLAVNGISVTYIIMPGMPEMVISSSLFGGGTRLLPRP